MCGFTLNELTSIKVCHTKNKSCTWLYRHVLVRNYASYWPQMKTFCHKMNLQPSVGCFATMARTIESSEWYYDMNNIDEKETFLFAQCRQRGCFSFMSQMHVKESVVMIKVFNFSDPTIQWHVRRQWIFTHYYGGIQVTEAFAWNSGFFLWGPAAHLDDGKFIFHEIIREAPHYEVSSKNIFFNWYLLHPKAAKGSFCMYLSMCI